MRRAAWILVTWLCAAAPAQTLDTPLARAERILPESLELEHRLEPWCPGDCTYGISFVAEYHRGRERLVFAATHHAFDPQSPTMQAVAHAFARSRPGILISEAFPTVMGENPPPLVRQARHYGDAGDDEFLRSEFAYALSLALERHVPFIGAELTHAQEMAVARQAGFTDSDNLFAAMLGLYSQGLRAGNAPDASWPSIAAYYPSVSERIRMPPGRGGLGRAPLSLDAFRERYRETYGVDPAGDAALSWRGDVALDTSRMGDRSRLVMRLRDRHLLALIEQQLDARHSVTVVFGSPHWATLSAALEERLGKPLVTPFPG